MYLLEHDAKTVLAEHGIIVPPGTLCESADALDVDFDGPWIVKGQIAAGGRGKAGIIKKAATREEVPRAEPARRLLQVPRVALDR